jgi:hypothetical protein
MGAKTSERPLATGRYASGRTGAEAFVVIWLTSLHSPRERHEGVLMGVGAGMDYHELLAFLRRHRLAVEATVSSRGVPQAAVVGIGVSDDLEIVFDTLRSTRKYENLTLHPDVALVVGWDERTAQIEGVADEPIGEELERIRQVYFAAYPDGPERLAWPGITHIRVRPTWIRYTDFSCAPPRMVELSGSALRRRG